MGLTNRQKLFVKEYLINGNNATQAAISAGYSEKTAYSQGQRALKHDEIKKQINREMDKSYKRLDINRDELLLNAYKISKVYDELLDLSLKDKLTEEEEEKFKRLKQILKASDSNKAIELIYKAKGWNEAEKQEITHKVEQPLFGPPKDDKENK